MLVLSSCGRGADASTGAEAAANSTHTGRWAPSQDAPAAKMESQKAGRAVSQVTPVDPRHRAGRGCS